GLPGVGVGLDHLGGGDHRAEQGLPDRDDAELDLGAADPASPDLTRRVPNGRGHWSTPLVGMETSTTRSPRTPVSRAHSCGLEVLGRSALSANSASTASRKSSVVRPCPVPWTMSLIASFLARSTMLRSIAPEVRSARYREDRRPEAYTR